MAGQIRLGRAFGIAVAVHWSVLVIALLFVWSLAKASLPALSPGQSPLAYWTTATATTVLLFGSLLAHELAHAVVARREGVGVEQMTLWLFGGVTTLRGEPESPGAAFRIAAAGPVTSLVLGGVFVGTGYASRLLNAPQLAVAAAMWLGATNVILAAFNLVPGAPLDGGRVLRAYLWRRRGDLAHATVTAARAGQAVGLALAAVGLGELLAGDAGNGLWLAFIGCFLVTAATQERNNALLRRRFADVRVAEVMTPDPETAPGSLPVEKFLDSHLLARDDSLYPVTDAAGDIRGVVTVAGLRGLSIRARTGTRLGDVAVPLSQVLVADADDSLAQIRQRIAQDGDRRARDSDRCMLVFAGDRLVGILTPADVALAAQSPITQKR